MARYLEKNCCNFNREIIMPEMGTIFLLQMGSFMTTSCAVASVCYFRNGVLTKLQNRFQCKYTYLNRFSLLNFENRQSSTVRFFQNRFQCKYTYLNRFSLLNFENRQSSTFDDVYTGKFETLTFSPKKLRILS